jgi:rod shape-determining protein MreD
VRVPAWIHYGVRLVLFFLVLVVTQGFLSTLMAPLPAPDLFLIAVLTLLYRLPAYQLVLAGYGFGLMQDVMGHGALGVHALGLAGAALVATTVRAQLSQSGFLERSLAVVAAVAGKWLVIAVLLAWLAGGPSTLGAIMPIAALDVTFTVVASTVLLPWGYALLARTTLLKRRELL